MAGSSPLTRGKHAGRHAAHARQRLIPAHAGKTLPREEQVPARRAHPRSRGENALDARPHAVNEGLIPAHAGKTFRASRACTSDPGSSPLTRGKRSTEAMNRVQAGLIPAHAGKTRPASGTGRAGAAHPRSRGENAAEVASRAGEGGSSPLTRGKHFLTCAFIAQIGQILESLELCASSESYSSPEAYATDALQGRVRSIDLGLRSSRGAS